MVQQIDANHYTAASDGISMQDLIEVVQAGAVGPVFLYKANMDGTETTYRLDGTGLTEVTPLEAGIGMETGSNEAGNKKVGGKVEKRHKRLRTIQCTLAWFVFVRHLEKNGLVLGDLNTPHVGVPPSE